jgi:nucleotide-binding universal stress UspA family protein
VPLDASLQIETIVVGYDGTEQAERALAHAAALAAAFGSKLVVTSVVAPTSDVLPNWQAAEPGRTPELRVEALDRARGLLAGRGLDVEYQPAIGEPADAITEVAERRQADLIVVGTRSPGAVERLLGHSVSHAVLRDARCNVLVVRL